jgi:hypothetical protein
MGQDKERGNQMASWYSVNGRVQKKKKTKIVWPCKKNGRVHTARKSSRNENN